MPSISAVDVQTGRKFYLDDPDDLKPGEPLVFLLNLHGGGSVGAWQRAYFPVVDHKEAYRLVITTPSAATKEPSRRWVAEADDAHLHNIVHFVFGRYGAENIRSFWLVGHSQGGMTANRLLHGEFFRDRVDGWLSLSGGRIGPIELPEAFFRGRTPPAMPPGMPRPGEAFAPDLDMSFIFAVGEHEMVALPETSPWAEKYGAGPKQRLADVVDTEPGQIYDTSSEGNSNASWGLAARPGRAQVYVYPNARDRRVIADVVRLDKGHTEGLEPNITRTLVEMLVAAPGGKAQRLLARRQREARAQRIRRKKFSRSTLTLDEARLLLETIGYTGGNDDAIAAALTLDDPDAADAAFDLADPDGEFDRALERALAEDTKKAT